MGWAIGEDLSGVMVVVIKTSTTKEDPRGSDPKTKLNHRHGGTQEGWLGRPVSLVECPWGSSWAQGSQVGSHQRSAEMTTGPAAAGGYAQITARAVRLESRLPWPELKAGVQIKRYVEGASVSNGNNGKPVDTTHNACNGAVTSGDWGSLPDGTGRIQSQVVAVD